MSTILTDFILLPPHRGNRNVRVQFHFGGFDIFLKFGSRTFLLCTQYLGSGSATHSIVDYSLFVYQIFTDQEASYGFGDSCIWKFYDEFLFVLNIIHISIAEPKLFFSCSDSGSTLVPKFGSGSCHILPLKNFGSGSSSRSQIISAPLAPAPQHWIKSPYNMWKIYSWNMLYIRHYTLIEIIFFIVNLQLYFYYQTKILNFVTPIMTYFM